MKMPDSRQRPSRLSSRPTLSALQLMLLAALFMLAVNNATFWKNVAAVFAGNPLDVATFGAIGFMVIMFSLSLLCLPRLQKPVLAGLLILSAVSAYYQDTLGVTIDRDMIQNAVNTTNREAKHLITAGFITKVLFSGILPALLVFWPRIRPTKLWRSALGWLVLPPVTFALFMALIFTDFKTFSAAIREHKELGWSIQPAAPLAGAFNYAKMMLRSRNVVAAPLGLDAHKGPHLAAAQKPVFMVIVVGETARAQDFSLGGYDRDTNPELKARDVLYFNNVSSCGTSTAVSMPCMMSRLTKTHYSYGASRAEENLLDVLTHAGFHVEWFDNNTGDLGIAQRIKSTMLTDQKDPVSCAKGECEDSIFFKPLQEQLDKATGNTVIVLHQIGSHGPAYFLRYSDAYERFKPACKSAAFADCTTDEIVNAYDNTIAFTDHFLSTVIDMLNSQDKALTAMYYVSDHGESLGENGVYLHAAPYFMAPIQQTHVPMVMWTSKPFADQFALNEACLRSKASEPLSHDNLFHTILGLLDIETEVHVPALDLTDGCKNG